MNTFNREFDVKLAEEALAPKNIWFRDLLKYWRPAGETPGTIRDKASDSQPGADHLRLAIRDGYLNFYRAGQSVAKVMFANGKLVAETHNKFVYGEKGSGDAYVKITGDEFTACDGSPVRYSEDLVRSWIAAASRYAEGEKLFVDGLVASDANVIDLEAGLPADPELWDKKSAPRMDLVSLEPCDDQHWRLVFWEAKLAKNSEARCRTGLPPVVDQLKKYEKWLEKNREIVIESYQRACAAMVQLHRIAKTLYPDKADLGKGIVTVAGQDASEIGFDGKPRLIIDDRSKDTAFTENGHLKKLRDHGVRVHMIRSASDVVVGADA
jgi:hypothetical protein